MSKSKDITHNLQKIAYKRYKGNVGNTTFQDFVIFCKSKLCVWSNTLFNDPVWDLYTPEEIMIEYFTVQFEKNPDFLKEYEMSQDTSSMDFVDWAELQIKKEKEEREKRLKEMEDRISFSPDSLGDN